MCRTGAAAGGAEVLGNFCGPVSRTLGRPNTALASATPKAAVCRGTRSGRFPCLQKLPVTGSSQLASLWPNWPCKSR